MESKKNPQADLHRRKGLFFTIGLVVTCMLVLSAFEWKTYTKTVKVDVQDIEEEDIFIEIPITEIKPPAPVIQQPEVVEVPDKEKNENFPDFEFPDLIETPIIKANVIAKPKEPPVMIEEPIEEPIVLFSETQATPKGGYKAFYKYIAEHLKYPAQARRTGIEGRVFIQFVVEKDGSLTDIKVIKGIGAGCDEEAVRVLKNAPQWNPGKQRGNPVRIRRSIPVLFRLQ